MKRDWELVRQILIAVEALESHGQVVRSSAIEGYDHELVAYHIHMLIESGLIDGTCSRSINGPRQCVARELTWPGHEFLDQIRSQKVWSRTLGLIREKGLDLSFETIKAAAGTVVTSLLS
jgi:hypothetical protein